MSGKETQTGRSGKKGPKQRLRTMLSGKREGRLQWGRTPVVMGNAEGRLHVHQAGKAANNQLWGQEPTRHVAVWWHGMSGVGKVPANVVGKARKPESFQPSPCLHGTPWCTIMLWSSSCPRQVQYKAEGKGR